MSDAPLPLRLFGVDFEVATPLERRDDIARQWNRCAPHAPGQRTIAPLATAPSSRGEAAPLTVTRGPDEEREAHVADYALTTLLTGRAIAANAERYVMLHAGGVCGPDTGVVAGLVAASGTGKTTATRHFCTHGYGYVTDETLIFNAEREILPYPKPLSVVIEPTDPRGKTQHSPDDLGLAEPPPGSLTLGPIILLDRIRDNDPAPDEHEAAPPGETPSLTPVDLFEGLTEVLPQSSAMPQIPGCLDLLARVAVAGGGFRRLRYRDIHDTDALLAQAFTAAPQEPTWRHVPGTWSARRAGVDPYLPLPAPRESLPPLSPDTPVGLAPFVDALVDEETMSALALVGSTPALLRGIGAVVFLSLLDGERTMRELVEACTESLGEHPQARELVTAAVHQLRESGVVELASDA